MSRASARWQIAPPPEPARVAALVAALHIPDTLAALLIQRGFATADAAQRFLRPKLDLLSDPSLLKDMDRAVAVIADAVRAGRRILIHGDYDVDGQCATALLTRVLRQAGADVVPFVPHRVRDGYDFGPPGLRRAEEVGAGLVITCDCGSTAREAVARGKERGLAIVVTDHHLTRDLPPADAVVNPQQPDCPSPAKELCGTGIALKLAQALVRELGLPVNLAFHLLDLVALATVADVVPLTGENRVLVRYGLRLLARTRWPGLRALLEVAGLSGQTLRAGHLGYILAPRLNAAGRIGEAMDGLRLLLSDDPAEAMTLAQQLSTLNARRQAMDDAMLEEAAEEMERTVDLARTYSVVLAREGWHPGVIGLVASRLVERYSRPTILVALDGGEGRGSGRSIPGFDLHAALAACAEHLARFGGHRMAAGLTVERHRLERFRAAFEAVARERLTPEDLTPTQRIDLVVSVDRLTDALERLLRHLEPCGPGNPAPVLGVVGAEARGLSVVGSNHLRFSLDDGTAVVGAIGFDWADRVERGWMAAPLDVALRLERNEWRGTSTLQARVVHLKPTG